MWILYDEEVGMIQRNENSKHARKTTELLQHKDSLTRKGERRDINEYHTTLGHPSEAITRATACIEGIKF